MAMILEKTTRDLSLDVRRHAPEAEASPPPRADREHAVVSARQTRVTTARFGLLDADPDLVLTFPEGLIGFAHCRSYIVVRHQDTSAFRWLQCLDEPHIAFPIVEPREFCADYAPTITDADARFLELTGDTPVLLFTIMTVPPRAPADTTANLLAPLVINGLTRQGKQVIAQDEHYTTRHKVTDELARRERARTLSGAAEKAPLRKSA